MAYECRICHTIQEPAEGLCQPVQDSTDCETYTEVHANIEEACAPAKDRVSFFCQGCGRLSVVSEEVCLPEELAF
jgi:hypothetical protein